MIQLTLRPQELLIVFSPVIIHLLKLCVRLLLASKTFYFPRNTIHHFFKANIFVLSEGQITLEKTLPHFSRRFLQI